MRQGLIAAALAVAIGTVPFGAGRAQELNQRTEASPEAAAKLGQILSQSAIEAENKQGLLPQDIVNNNCGPLQVGTTPPQTNNLVTAQDNEVVVRGNVVNVCH